MKILIDFTQIPLKKVGVGIYGLNLVKALLEIDENNRYFVLIQDDERCFDNFHKHNLSLIKVKSKIFRNLFFRFFLEQLYIPYLIIRYKINVIHSLHYSFPLISFGVKRVVTVHDLTFFLIPEVHTPVKRIYFKIFIRLTAKYADRIITDSLSTRKDYLKLFNVEENKLSSIHLGKDTVYNKNLEPSLIETVKRKYGIYDSYILYLGTIEPRKNIKNLIHAFKDVIALGHKLILVIAGSKGWYYKDIFSLPEYFGISQSVLFTGFIEESDKPFLLGGAKIFTYISFYEGFGLPVLEALSCGVPTITSNISSMPEIAGDAALYVDPDKVNDITEAILLLLNNQTLYTQLKKKSLLRASQFTWIKTSQQTLEVYNSLFSG